MRYRHVGKHGIQVSEVGLGSWLTYGNATDTRQAEACIDRAYEKGVNFFDTADAYAGGEAEKVVGKALAKYRRDSFVLSTKIFFPMGPGPNQRGLSRKHLFDGCHAALKRLNMDYIDLYQCHRYDEGTPLEETLHALDDLTTQGKILYYGVSEWTAEQITRAVSIVRAHHLHPIAVNQPQYSMLARGIERDVIPTCEREGIGQVVFSPLAQGVLTGKYKPGQPPPTGSRAADPKQNQFFKTGVLDAYVHDRVAADDSLLERVGRLAPIAQNAGLSLAQMALAWCLRLANVASVIIGASQIEQVDQNVTAAGQTLTPDVLAQIDAALGFRSAA